MAIHYIQMNDSRATLDSGQNVVGQVGEICRQNRRCEFDQNTRFLMSGDSHNFSKRAYEPGKFQDFGEILVD